jgi:O-antigen/teichoic acid export membrane protein
MKESKLRKNSIYNIGGGLVRLGFGILTIPILIRSLGAEQYGLWSLAIAVVSIVTLAEGGLSMATTVFVSQDISQRDEESLCETLTSSLLLIILAGTVASIFLWNFSDSIIKLLPQLSQAQSSELNAVLQMASFLVWFKIVQQVLIGVEQAYERYDLINVTTSFVSTLTSVGMILVAIQGAHLIDLMKLQVASAIIMFATHMVVVAKLLQSRSIHLFLKFDRVLDIGKYGFSLWLNSLGSTAFSKLDRVIVGNFLGSEGLGIYSGITDVTSQINVLSALPVQPIVPVVSKFFGQPSMIAPQVERSLKINAIVSVAMCACFIVFSDECINLLFPGYLNNNFGLAFKLATIIYSAYSLNAVGYYILLATKTPGLCTAIVLFSGSLSLFLIAILAGRFGLIGAVLGNAGYLFTLSLCTVAFKKLGLSFKSLMCNSVLVPLVWLFIVLLVDVISRSIWDNFYVKSVILLFEIFSMLTWYLFFKEKLVLRS